jgi:hypothetical protein
MMMCVVYHQRKVQGDVCQYVSQRKFYGDVC